MSERLGIEIIIEPDVVPRGTIDLRSLDAPAGAAPPPRRIEPDGRVFAIAVATPAASSSDDSSAGKAIVASNAKAFGVDGADPGPPTTVKDLPAAAVLAGDRRVVSINPVDIDVPDTSERPKGRSARRKAVSGESAIPPRPASADAANTPARAGDARAVEDYETEEIAGGVGSAIGTLVKIVAVLAAFTLSTWLLILWLGDTLPFGGPAVAKNGNGKHDAPKVEPPKPESAKIEKPEPKVEPKPEAEKPKDGESSKAGLGDLGGVTPAKTEPGASPVEPAPKPGVAKVDVPLPDIGSDVGVEEEKPGTIQKVEALRAEGVRRMKAGEWDAALKAFDDLLAISTNDPHALFLRASCLHRKGDYDAAEKAYEVAIAATPDDPRPWNNLGLVRLERGKRDPARAAFEKALEKDAQEPNALTNLASLDREKDPALALQRYDRALARDQNHESARLNRGLLRLAMGQLGPAGDDLKVVADGSGPQKARALDGLGRIAMEEGKPVEAEAFLRQAVAASPKYAEARIDLGVALVRKGDPAAAEKELRALIESRPRDAKAWTTLGTVLVRLDRLKEAKGCYERALEIDDKDPTAHFDYGLCAERFGYFNIAIQEYESALKLDARQWKAASNLARIYREHARNTKEDATRQKYMGRALETLDKAIAARPEVADLHLSRANTLADMRRDGDARAELAAFVKLAPATDPRAASAKRALEDGATPPPPDSKSSEEPPPTIPVPPGAPPPARTYK